MGCSPRSFSSDEASVEKPVLVFLVGVRPSSSNSTVRSCSVLFTLKSCPASAWIWPVSSAHSATSRSFSRRSSTASTPTPTRSIRASTRTSGTSRVVVQRAQALRVERGGDGPDEPVDGQRVARGEQRDVGRPLLEGELALGGAGVGRQLEVGVAQQQLAQHVAGLGRVEQVGGQLGVDGQGAHVDVDAQQGADERLGVVRGDRAGGEYVLQRGPHARVVEDRGGEHEHLGHFAVGHQRQRVDRRASRGSRPRRRRPTARRRARPR